MIYGNFNDNLKEPSMTYTGVAEALMESAQSDLNMFKAMLALDAYEIKLNEAAGADNNKESIKDKMKNAGQAASGAVGRIMKAIADGLEKLADFLYNAYGTVAMKVRQLMVKDVELAAKGLKNVKAENLKDVKVKWLKIKHNPFLETAIGAGGFDPNKKYESEILKEGYFFDGKTIKDAVEDVDATGKLNDIKAFFNNGNGAYKKVAQFAKTGATIRNTLRKDAAKYRQATKTKDASAEEANRIYKAFSEFRKTRTKEVSAIQSAMTNVLKMYRAALYIVLRKGSGKVKAADESAILDFIAQEACYEVDDVMKGIITGGNISEFAEAALPHKSSMQEHAELMEAMSAPIF